jgi:cytochrome oxidase assembly protein ShyY1
MNIGFKYKPWPSMMTAIMLGVLLALGFWQAHRAEWKSAIINERTEKLSMKPLTLSGVPDGPVSNLYYRGAYVTSPVTIARPYYTFTHDPEHGIGFQLYFPEKWNNDRWLLRKSDFLTMAEWKSGDYHWPSNDDLTKAGTHQQLGLFIPLEITPNYFVFKDKGSESIKPLEQLEPLLFIPIDEWGSVNHEVLKAKMLNIPNNHAIYAIIWFLLAIAMLVIYLAAHTTIRMKSE